MNIREEMEQREMELCPCCPQQGQRGRDRYEEEVDIRTVYHGTGTGSCTVSHLGG